MVNDLLQGEDPDIVDIAKRCSIPRFFHAGIMMALADEPMTIQHTESILNEINDLELVQDLGNGSFVFRPELREQVRTELQMHSRDQFLDLNKRAYSYFDSQLPSGYKISEVTWGQLRREQLSALRERIYHLLQIDFEAGFSEFQLLLRGAQDLSLVGEASALLKIINSLDKSLLNEEQQNRLEYFDAWQNNADGDVGSAEAKLSKLLEKTLSDSLRSQVLILLGNIYEDRMRFDKAIEALQEAQKISISLQLPRQSAALANNIGRILYRQKNFANAEKLFQQALDEFEKIGDIVGESKSLNNLGSVRLRQARWKEAFDLFEKSIALKLQIGDYFGAALTRRNIGMQYQELSQYDQNDKSSKLNREKAIQNYLDSLETFTAMGALSNQARVLYELARLYDKVHDEAQARKFLAEALPIYQTLRLKAELNESAWLVKKLGLQA
jgi:tetratricopeptide (TPR) repeat protein